MQDTVRQAITFEQNRLTAILHESLERLLEFM